jgi:hypothetical protein
VVWGREEQTTLDSYCDRSGAPDTLSDAPKNSANRKEIERLPAKSTPTSTKFELDGHEEVVWNQMNSLGEKDEHTS